MLFKHQPSPAYDKRKL